MNGIYSEAAGCARRLYAAGSLSSEIEAHSNPRKVVAPDRTRCGADRARCLRSRRVAARCVRRQMRMGRCRVERCAKPSLICSRGDCDAVGFTAGPVATCSAIPGAISAKFICALAAVPSPASRSHVRCWFRTRFQLRQLCRDFRLRFNRGCTSKMRSCAGCSPKGWCLLEGRLFRQAWSSATRRNQLARKFNQLRWQQGTGLNQRRGQQILQRRLRFRLRLVQSHLASARGKLRHHRRSRHCGLHWLGNDGRTIALKKCLFPICWTVDGSRRFCGICGGGLSAIF